MPVELSVSTFLSVSKSLRVQHQVGWTLMLMAAAALRETMGYV